MYRMNYKDCPAKYTRETGKKLETRLYEHNAPLDAKTKFPNYECIWW